jgi:hypothetical protein
MNAHESFLVAFMGFRLEEPSELESPSSDGPKFSPAG